MLYPIKVVDIELSKAIPTFDDLENYMGLQGLVRIHGVPLGYVKAPISLGKCTASTLSKLILGEYSEKIICQLLKNGLASPHCPANFKLEDLLNLPPVEYVQEWPLVTVAVCTRDRPDDMKLCLEAIRKLEYPHLDILVIDNSPQTEATKELIDIHYPEVRYVREPRPGLDWARNCAILEAKGEIIAYTDDDVVVDPSWVKAIAQTFLEDPEVMAVTGLVVPYELETEAQVLFEEYGGFGKGFLRHEYQVSIDKPMPWWMLGAGQCGTGANMAYRRSVFSKIGGFDPALDVGTVTNGGGDLEMFFRIIREHYLLVYEPTVIVKHRHRQSYEKLKTQITNNGIGLYSYFTCGVKFYPEMFWTFLRIGLWWFIYWYIRRAWISFKHPTKIPAELVWIELTGVFIGLRRYAKARQQVQEIINKFGGQSPSQTNLETSRQLFPPVSTENITDLAAPISSEKHQTPKLKDSVGVRQIHLEKPLTMVSNIENYPKTLLVFTWHDDPIGSYEVENKYNSISCRKLQDILLKHFSDVILCKLLKLHKGNHWSIVYNSLLNFYNAQTSSQPPRLPKNVKVSINLATFDRPDDLRNCLTCLQNQKTEREVEIIVVDNHPQSNLTPPVVAEFPNVKLVIETRQGLAYARNAGFVASTGDIVIATDDDVTIPTDWLEKLVAPFVRSDVMIVTGNILPLQLETPSQQFFEKYGGLGRGFERFEVKADWFESSPRYAIPTWKLGATANAAFRSTILSHSKIGLMDESLGPGMPSGVGEDTYLFYKTLKVDYTLIYEPCAYLWHKHRQDIMALRRQIYGYSKGHVSYNLTTWLRDGDWRGLYQIFVALPLYHAGQLVNCFLRKNDYPLSLIFLEIWGNLAGPWSLWRSRIRVNREGYSALRSNPNQE
ncbi:glycosyltransferase [Pseudanabaena sp. FACHB-1998]|uniref:glycosyltransferase n=1 Tax=Pseudanabaena sp. FACHB-1998 TaxID=2692858 RepID=UPI0016808687|nr:glycosyltransferase [Pseudanabaena sp. FACHB-1998]MBD2176715.1 glycosyltransferase [Pseudanabaena sp. FACHB-1998]